MEEFKGANVKQPKFNWLVICVLATVALVVIGYGAGVYQDHIREEKRIADELLYQQRKDNLARRATEFATHVDTLADSNANDGKAVLKELIGIARDIRSLTLRPFLVERYGDQTEELVARIDEFVLFEKTASEEERANSSVQDIDRYIQQMEARLRRLTSENKQQGFIVYRQFGTDSSGRGQYEAYDVERVRKCVLIAKAADLTGIGNLQQSNLYVRFVGDLPVQIQNYNTFQNFKTTEYMATYEATKVGSEIRTLQEQLEDAQSAKWEVRERWETLNSKLLNFHAMAREIAAILDDRYRHANLAEKFEDAVNRPPGTYRFKDGELTTGQSGHGDIIRVFKRGGMTVDEAVSYARVMGAKDEHLAKSRREGTTVKFFSKTGGVTVFLDRGKSNEVMFWIPEAVVLKTQGMSSAAE